MDAGAPRLALIDWVERDGRAAHRLDVHAWPLTIGRALDNDIVLDDPYVAARHARLQTDADGRLQLLALPGINGLRIGRRRLAPGQAVDVTGDGAVVQIGQSRLRVRLPGEALAAERPLQRGALVGPLLAGAALLAYWAASSWIERDPGADFSNWLPDLLGLPIAVAVWCGLWALLSKVFQHRFDFNGHLRIALPWLLAATLFVDLWPELAAAVNAPRLWLLSQPIAQLLLAAMIHAHLRRLLPAYPRAVSVAVVALTLGGGLLSMALTYRSTDRLLAAPYMSTLPMPALRLAGTVPPEQLVQSMQPLAARLAERVRQAQADDAGDDDD